MNLLKRIHQYAMRLRTDFALRKKALGSPATLRIQLDLAENHISIEAQLQENTVHETSRASVIDLIAAFWSRHDLLYSYVLEAAVLGAPSLDLSVGDQLLADAAFIDEWTRRLLARQEELTRAQRLNVWFYRLRALSNEWG